MLDCAFVRASVHTETHACFLPGLLSNQLSANSAHCHDKNVCVIYFLVYGLWVSRMGGEWAAGTERVQFVSIPVYRSLL